MSYSLIIPIYNEENSLPTLLKKLNALPKNIEIIIIDDGSSDKTSLILKSITTRIKILKNSRNFGKGYSIKRGINHSTNKNIILMDGDLEINIDDIPKLIKKFISNSNNAIVGTRWSKKSAWEYNINSLGNYFINFLFNQLYNSDLSDILCCVKIMNKALIKSLHIKSNGFGIEAETMAKLILKNIDIEEVNINYKRRTKEQGKKLRLSDSWNIIFIIFKLKLMGNIFSLKNFNNS